MRHVPDSERRARLARRHAVAPAHRVADVEAATRAMVVLHATDAASVHLQAAARVDGLTTADVEAALEETRTVVKQLAMRRTLFAFPRDLLAAAVGSAGARVASTERARLVKDVVAGGLAADATAGHALVARAGDAVVRHLTDDTPGSGMTTRQLGAAVPELAGRVLSSAGTRWESSDPFGPRVLTVLGAEGRIVRGPNELGWRTPRYRWTTMDVWLGEPLVPLSPEAGWAELTRRWLYAFGPATEADLVWWLGSTKTAVRRALADVGAVQVTVDGASAGAAAAAGPPAGAGAPAGAGSPAGAFAGDREGGGARSTAYLLPDDLEPEPEVEPWAALLPTLDPTTMGWKERGFYLAPEKVPYLFDSAGNAAHTAWWCGRVVGTWVQDDTGVVRVVAHEDLSPDARRGLDAEATRLATWLGDDRVTHVYGDRLASRTPLRRTAD